MPSVNPCGEALGVTYQSPQTDRYSYSAQYLRGRITGALGEGQPKRSSTET